MADIGGDGASLMMGGFDPSAFTGEFSPRRVTLWTCSLGMPWCPLGCLGVRVCALGLELLVLLCCFASQCLVGSFASLLLCAFVSKEMRPCASCRSPTASSWMPRVVISRALFFL